MQRKPRPLFDLLFGILLPSLILMKFSGPEDLGAPAALVLALVFPISLGLYELIRFGATNWIAVLGLVSVLLTGGIGLLELDARWLAVKEAAIPALIGIAILVAARLGYPLVGKLIYNPMVLDTDRISRVLRERGYEELFELRLRNATYLVSATFFFSAVMNYLLATWIVTSPAGTTAFNEELGQLTLVSYPVIALPSMIMMLVIFYFLWRTISGLTGLKFEEVLAPSLHEDKQ
ncbi:MAG: VC0807 family protein [Gammaproteobacteria bacterium]|nr:VC0807 family protein [Gammaproteobacteria bacterium]